MNNKNLIQRVTTIAEENGWNVSVEDANGSATRFEFQRYANHGLDFSFTTNMQDGDLATLISCVEDYYSSFDPDYEAYLWIGSNGHGKNGAPYFISHIIADTEEIDDQMMSFLRDLRSCLINLNRSSQL